jgi:hypothetical protein
VELKSPGISRILLNSPDVVAFVAAVGWPAHYLILAHLTDPRVFSVRVAFELALSCCLAWVLVDFFVINWVIDLDAGSSGSGT